MHRCKEGGALAFEPGIFPISAILTAETPIYACFGLCRGHIAVGCPPASGPVALFVLKILYPTESCLLEEQGGSSAVWAGMTWSRRADMKAGKKVSCEGFTLVEVVIASALLTLMAGGMYAGAIMAMRLIRFNAVSTEARALASQKLDETVALGFDGVVLGTPFPAQTNRILHTPLKTDGIDVVREIAVIGHTEDHHIATNLASSSYLECHVDVTYVSPLNKRTRTDSISTLIKP